VATVVVSLTCPKEFIPLGLHVRFFIEQQLVRWVWKYKGATCLCRQAGATMRH